MIDPWAHVSSHSMDEAVDLLAQRSPALWARRRRRLRGLPYGFGASDAPLHQQRPFLRLMMEDQSTVKVYRKPRQVGVSESSVTEVLWCMDTADSSRTLVYTLPSNILLTKAIIEACIDSTREPRQGKVPGAGAVAAGVDWGDVSWIVIGQEFGKKLLVLYAERLAQDDPDAQVRRVAELVRLFDIRYLVADAGYGKDRNSALLKAFPGRVWSCWYPVMEKTSKVFEPQWQDQEHKVTVDRTTSLKLAARSFREHEVVLCDLRRLEIWRTFLSHLTNLAASKEQDDETGEIIETIKPTGPDHLAHAYNYLWTAFTGKLLRPGGRTFIFFLG